MDRLSPHTVQQREARQVVASSSAQQSFVEVFNKRNGLIN